MKGSISSAARTVTAAVFRKCRRKFIYTKLTTALGFYCLRPQTCEGRRWDSRVLLEQQVWGETRVLPPCRFLRLLLSNSDVTSRLHGVPKHQNEKFQKKARHVQKSTCGSFSVTSASPICGSLQFSSVFLSQNLGKLAELQRLSHMVKKTQVWLFVQTQNSGAFWLSSGPNSIVVLSGEPIPVLFPNSYAADRFSGISKRDVRRWNNGVHETVNTKAALKSIHSFEFRAAKKKGCVKKASQKQNNWVLWMVFVIIWFSLRSSRRPDYVFEVTVERKTLLNESLSHVGWPGRAVWVFGSSGSLGGRGGERLHLQGSTGVSAVSLRLVGPP